MFTVTVHTTHHSSLRKKKPANSLMIERVIKYADWDSNPGPKFIGLRRSEKVYTPL